jgi:hypothetical protein
MEQCFRLTNLVSSCLRHGRLFYAAIWNRKQGHEYASEWISHIFQTFQFCTCLCVPVLNQAPGHDGVCGSRRIAPHIFNFCTRGSSVVIFTPRSLHPGGRAPWYPLNSLSQRQSQLRRFGEDINLLLLPAVETRFLGYPFRSLVTIRTELSLHVSIKNNAFILFLFCPAVLMVPRKDTWHKSGKELYAAFLLTAKYCGLFGYCRWVWPFKDAGIQIPTTALDGWVFNLYYP